jgi:hypothetical protein
MKGHPEGQHIRVQDKEASRDVGQQSMKFSGRPDSMICIGKRAMLLPASDFLKRAIVPQQMTLFRKSLAAHTFTAKQLGISCVVQ